MFLDADVTPVLISTTLCVILIVCRCGYRWLADCKKHTACYKRWHVDDTLMLLALLPLIGRTACIMISFEEARVVDDQMDSETAAARLVVSRKLLVPSRVFYAAFLWMLKICLLLFYVRLFKSSDRAARIAKVLLWIHAATFVAVVLTTVLECIPVSLYWEPNPLDGALDQCSKALVQMLTMAILNLLTDVCLMIFPLPLIWRMNLSLGRKFQLAALLCAGFLCVIITVVRVPLIVNASVAQSTRSLWASIEILCACIAANAAFFYAVVNDTRKGGHDTQSQASETSRTDSIDEIVKKYGAKLPFDAALNVKASNKSLRSSITLVADGEISPKTLPVPEQAHKKEEKAVPKEDEGDVLEKDEMDMAKDDFEWLKLGSSV